MIWIIIGILVALAIFLLLAWLAEDWFTMGIEYTWRCSTPNCLYTVCGTDEAYVLSVLETHTRRCTGESCEEKPSVVELTTWR